MNVLVIGGTGFISSRLVTLLLNGGHRVTVFNRGRAGGGIVQRPDLERVVGDRTVTASLKSAFHNRTFDAVFDMVAYRPQESEAAAILFRGRAGRFVHCSTISVYMVSDRITCPVTEDQWTAPAMEFWERNPFGMSYGLAKRQCEEVLWRAHDEKAFPVSILRPTYVSGPDDPSRRDYFWIERILDRGPLLVPGSGDFAFQQVYVDDVARAFADLLENAASIGKAYNVAGEEIYSLNEYLKALASLLELPVELVHADQEKFDGVDISRSPDGDVFPFNTRRTAVFSLDAIKTDLGFRSTPFRQWLNSTVQWWTRVHRGFSVAYRRREEEVRFIEALKGRGVPAGRNETVA